MGCPINSVYLRIWGQIRDPFRLEDFPGIAVSTGKPRRGGARAAATNLKNTLNCAEFKSLIMEVESEDPGGEEEVLVPGRRRAHLRRAHPGHLFGALGPLRGPSPPLA